LPWRLLDKILVRELFFLSFLVLIALFIFKVFFLKDGIDHFINGRVLVPNFGDCFQQFGLDFISEENGVFVFRGVGGTLLFRKVLLVVGLDLGLLLLFHIYFFYDVLL
jgi:hypothetical protein